jgi:hypothetical protein
MAEILETLALSFGNDPKADVPLLGKHPEADLNRSRWSNDHLRSPPTC